MTTVMTQMVARLLLPPCFMVALAILVKGYADTGDGFSAGVVAALGVLLQYITFDEERIEQMLIVRWAPYGAVVGLILSLLVAFVPVLRGEALFTHSPAPGAAVVHLGSVELITALLFDVGVFLLVYGFAVGVVGTLAQTRGWSKL